MVVKDALLH